MNKITDEEALKYYKSMLFTQDFSEHTMKAIEAIEKQIAKEPTKRIIINNKIYGGDCPSCGKEINVMSCCHYCGQKIDW